MPLVGLMVVIPQLRCELHSYIWSSWLNEIFKKTQLLKEKEILTLNLPLDFLAIFFCPCCLGGSLHIEMKQMVENKIIS